MNRRGMRNGGLRIFLKARNYLIFVLLLAGGKACTSSQAYLGSIWAGDVLRLKEITYPVLHALLEYTYTGRSQIYTVIMFIVCYRGFLYFTTDWYAEGHGLIAQSHKVILSLWSLPFAKKKYKRQMFTNGMCETVSSGVLLRDITRSISGFA